MFCENCGTKLEKDDMFCPNCGQKVGGDNLPSTSEPSHSIDFTPILQKIKNYFKNPVGYYSTVKDNDKGRISLLSIIITPILCGLFLMIYCYSALGILIENIGGLYQKAGGITSSLASAFLSSSDDINITSSEIAMAKEKINDLVPYSKIFIAGIIATALIMLILMLIMVILNSTCLHKKLANKNIAFACSTSFVPLTLSLLISALIVQINMSFSLLFILLGFILSLIHVYIAISESDIGMNNTSYYLVMGACAVTSVLTAITCNAALNAALKMLIKKSNYL